MSDLETSSFGEDECGGSYFRYARAYVKYVTSIFYKEKENCRFPSSLLSEEGSKCMEASVPDYTTQLRDVRMSSSTSCEGSYLVRNRLQ